MAGVLNFTPSVISRPLSRFRREPNSRVCYVRSSAETPAVTSKEETPRLGVSSSTTPSFSPPPNFKPPQPKRFFIRPDKLFDILGASLALIFRLGTGVVVSGYEISSDLTCFVRLFFSFSDFRLFYFLIDGSLCKFNVNFNLKWEWLLGINNFMLYLKIEKLDLLGIN